MTRDILHGTFELQFSSSGLVRLVDVYESILFKAIYLINI